MALTIVDVDTPVEHCLVPDDVRPITAVILHDTETHANVATRPDGSWHYEIDRDGTIRAYVSEENIAFHVAAFGDNPRLNRGPRPAWLLASPYPVSDVNYCTIGIELVSDAQYRAAGQPYTTLQYVALRALLADLGARYGALPIVGHGELQTDRSDPVAFDWTKIGRTLPVPAVPISLPINGGAPMPPLTPLQADMLSLMDPPLNLNADSVRQLVSDRAALAEQADLLRKELDATKEQLAQVPPPVPPPTVTVTSAALAVRVTFSDGRAVEVPVGQGVPSDIP